MSKICTRCVMDSTAKEIVFDSNGICNFCHGYEDKSRAEVFSDKQGTELLDSLMNKIKESRSKEDYDVLIGLSGGVDSSYVAYILKKKYNLRILAVHVDNGWNTELSVANVERLVDRLDIDLITNVLNWKEFSDIQRAFLRSSISNIEIPTDHAIWATLLRTASKYKIPYIVAGNNVVTEAIMPESWLYGSKDALLIKDIHKKYGSLPLRTYPKLSLIDFVRFLLVKRIKWIPLLNYIDFNKASAKELLIKELGWRDYGGKHYENIYTRFFHADYLVTKFGYDLRKSYFSAMINSGQISRSEALLELKKPPIDKALMDSDRKYVMKKLQIGEEEFSSIISEEGRDYSEFKNTNNWWIRLSPIVAYAKALITKVE